MAYDNILTNVEDRVGVIRLNRPDKLNAWNADMGAEITDQITAWNSDPKVGAIVMTGEGRAFCAGADLDGFSDRAKANSSGQGETISRGGAGFTHFLQGSKPTVAAINGFAVGIGLTMVLPFDVRIASTDALMSIRFVKVGLIPELGSTRLLPQLVGLGNATDMCLTGRMVPADEALRIGLVTDVVEPEKLFDTALAKAKVIANNPPNAVQMIKELMRKNPMDPDLEAVMERELLRDQIARRHPDHKEAVAAFLEKREPNFDH